jgi:hypothetical protein
MYEKIQAFLHQPLEKVAGTNLVPLKALELPHSPVEQRLISGFREGQMTGAPTEISCPVPTWATKPQVCRSTDALDL